MSCAFLTSSGSVSAVTDPTWPRCSSCSKTGTTGRASRTRSTRFSTDRVVWLTTSRAFRKRRYLLSIRLRFRASATSADSSTSCRTRGTSVSTSSMPSRISSWARPAEIRNCAECLRPSATIARSSWSCPIVKRRSRSGFRSRTFSRRCRSTSARCTSTTSTTSTAPTASTCRPIRRIVPPSRICRTSTSARAAARSCR